MTKVGILLDKYEAIITDRKKRLKGDQLEPEETLEISDGDTRMIERTRSKHKGINKSRLNKLGMGSHRWGRRRDETKSIVTDNIDQGTTKVLTKVSYGKTLVGYIETSKLSMDTEIEWVTMTDDVYRTQLIYGIHPSKLPKKPLRSGGKVFLDPSVFINLVKYQEVDNDVKLTISYDRSKGKLRNGELSVVVVNPNNLMHDHPGKVDGPISADVKYSRSEYNNDASSGIKRKK